MHTHQVLNAGVPGSNQSNPARGASKGRYPTRFLSLESPSDFREPLGGLRDLNPSNNYERRPRHKTRPDRYNYKDQTFEVHKKGRRREKRTWAKMKRKRTINDDFHASNVPQNRLTVCGLQALIGLANCPALCRLEHGDLSKRKGIAACEASRR